MSFSSAGSKSSKGKTYTKSVEHTKDSTLLENGNVTPARESSDSSSESEESSDHSATPVKSKDPSLLVHVASNETSAEHVPQFQDAPTKDPSAAQVNEQSADNHNGSVKDLPAHVDKHKAHVHKGCHEKPKDASEPGQMTSNYSSKEPKKHHHFASHKSREPSEHLHSTSYVPKEPTSQYVTTNYPSTRVPSTSGEQYKGYLRHLHKQCHHKKKDHLTHKKRCKSPVSKRNPSENFRSVSRMPSKTHTNTYSTSYAASNNNQYGLARSGCYEQSRNPSESIRSRSNFSKTPKHVRSTSDATFKVQSGRNLSSCHDQTKGPSENILSMSHGNVHIPNQVQSNGTYTISHAPSKEPSGTGTYTVSHAPSKEPSGTGTYTVSHAPSKEPSGTGTYTVSHAPSKEPSGTGTYTISNAQSKEPLDKPSGTGTYTVHNAPSKHPSHTHPVSHASSSEDSSSNTDSKSSSKESAPAPAEQSENRQVTTTVSHSKTPRTIRVKAPPRSTAQRQVRKNAPSSHHQSNKTNNNNYDDDDELPEGYVIPTLENPKKYRNNIDDVRILLFGDLLDYPSPPPPCTCKEYWEEKEKEHVTNCDCGLEKCGCECCGCDLKKKPPTIIDREKLKEDIHKNSNNDKHSGMTKKTGHSQQSVVVGKVEVDVTPPSVFPPPQETGELEPYLDENNNVNVVDEFFQSEKKQTKKITFQLPSSDFPFDLEGSCGRGEMVFTKNETRIETTCYMAHVQNKSTRSTLRTGPKGSQCYNGTRGKTPYSGSAQNTRYTGNTGNTPYTGAAENFRDTGFAGSSQYTGTTGNNRYTGSAQNTRYTGTRGNTCYTGTKGNTPYTGSAQNTRYTGATGNTPYTGTRENFLDTGFAGPSQYTGTTGNTRYTGTTGNTPYTGSAQNTRYTGTKGNTCYKGTRGNTRYTGTTGNTPYTGSAQNTRYTGAAGNTPYTGTAENFLDSGFTEPTQYTGTTGNTRYTGTTGNMQQQQSQGHASRSRTTRRRGSRGSGSTSRKRSGSRGSSHRRRSRRRSRGRSRGRGRSCCQSQPRGCCCCQESSSESSSSDDDGNCELTSQFLWFILTMNSTAQYYKSSIAHQNYTQERCRDQAAMEEEEEEDCDEEEAQEETENSRSGKKDVKKLDVANLEDLIRRHGEDALLNKDVAITLRAFNPNAANGIPENPLIDMKSLKLFAKGEKEQAECCCDKNDESSCGACGGGGGGCEGAGGKSGRGCCGGKSKGEGGACSVRPPAPTCCAPGCSGAGTDPKPASCTFPISCTSCPMPCALPPCPQPCAPPYYCTPPPCYPPPSYPCYPPCPPACPMPTCYPPSPYCCPQIPCCMPTPQVVCYPPCAPMMMCYGNGMQEGCEETDEEEECSEEDEDDDAYDNGGGSRHVSYASGVGRSRRSFGSGNSGQISYGSGNSSQRRGNSSHRGNVNNGSRSGRFGSNREHGASGFSGPSNKWIRGQSSGHSGPQGRGNISGNNYSAANHRTQMGSSTTNVNLKYVRGPSGTTGNTIHTGDTSTFRTGTTDNTYQTETIDELD